MCTAKVLSKYPLHTHTENLQRFENRQHFTVTTSNDPVLQVCIPFRFSTCCKWLLNIHFILFSQRLASENAGNVYATDTILALLMSAPRSVNGSVHDMLSVISGTCKILHRILRWLPKMQMGFGFEEGKWKSVLRQTPLLKN